MLAVWAPSRFQKEVEQFRIPELQSQFLALSGRDLVYHAIPSQFQDGGGAIASIPVESDQETTNLLAAASRCVLLTVLVRELAACAESLSAALSEATVNDSRVSIVGSFQVLILGSSSQQRRTTRRMAARQLLADITLHQQQTLVERSEKGKHSGKDPMPLFWCIQVYTGFEDQIKYYIGTELTRGGNGKCSSTECTTTTTATTTTALDRAPTSMLPALAALSVNLASVGAWSVGVCDPCCGSGTLLQASASVGASAVFGADTDAVRLHTGNRGNRERVVADACSVKLRADCLDAIICDPPYDIRAAATTPPHEFDNHHHHGDKEVLAAWQVIVKSLLAGLVTPSLRVFGRFVCWMPHCVGNEAWLKTLSSEINNNAKQSGGDHEVVLVYYLRETRATGVQRAVAVWEKRPLDSSIQRRIITRRKVAPPVNTTTTTTTTTTTATATTATATTHSTTVTLTEQSRLQPYRETRKERKGACLDIWRASWLGDIAALQEFISAGGDPNSRDPKAHQTPLQFAAGYNRLSAVQALLAAGADPRSADDKEGTTALHRAAARGHTSVVDALLMSGRADAHQFSRRAQQTPLMMAAQFGHEDATLCLLRYFSCGGEEEVEKAVTAVDGGGLSAVHVAAQWGKASIIQLFVNFIVRNGDTDGTGIDLNVMSQGLCAGVSPAHLAARWGHVDVLRVLHAAGADLKVKSGGGEGKMPLDEAIEWQRPACVDYLTTLNE